MNYEKENQVRELAYYKWKDAGCPVSDGVEFWLDAEREVYILRDKDHINDVPTGPNVYVIDETQAVDPNYIRLTDWAKDYPLVYNRNFDLVPEFINRDSILKELGIERPYYTGFDKEFSGPMEHITIVG